MLRFSPRRPTSVWSKINRNRAEKLIAEGKMTAAGYAAIEEAKKSGAWDNAYTNLAPEDLPSDIQQALEASPPALQNFYGFATTYRNMYIYWVKQAKTVETRQKRIKKVVEQSLKNQKQIAR